MTLPPLLVDGILKMIDFIYAGVPRPRPPADRLARCRLIAHRGDSGNRTLVENTLPAFDRALAAGVWGLEFDVRWTRDLQPMVFHDPHLGRLFGCKERICDLTLEEVKAAFPLIPALGEVIARYGRRLHLMIELKRERYPDPGYQYRLLQDLLQGLEPGEDFHLIGLDPELLRPIAFVPRQTLLPIAQLNVSQVSRLSLGEEYGGILGHYLFVTETLIQKHRRGGQQAGTGFVNSRRCLFRELNRGVDWIFSDRAVSLQALCHRRDVV